jgi:hypothetical protein
VALWVNHLRVGSVQSFYNVINVLAGALYDLLVFFLILLILVLPMMSTTDCYTPRAKVTELLRAANNVHEDINKRISQHQSITAAGVGLQIELSGRVKEGFVSSDGVIVVAGEDPPAVVIFQPTFANGEVTWKCSGFPKKYMPPLCR